MSSRPGRDALGAGGEQRGAGGVEAGGRGRGGAVGQVEDVLALEVARLGDAVVGEDRVGVERGGLGVGPAGADRRGTLQHRPHLVRRPDVELALLALRVGVVGRVEAALGPAHLAQQPVERLFADPPVALVAEHLPTVQVGAREQGVVVEHLLEVGDEPGRVDRVAGEAPADLVVDATGEHRVEGAFDVLQAGRRDSAAAPASRSAGTSAPARSRRWPGPRARAGSSPPPPIARARAPSPGSIFASASSRPTIVAARSRISSRCPR